MHRFLLAAVFTLIGGGFVLAEEKTWEGGWTNQKFGTKGRMTCVASEGAGGVWKATFSGKFQGRPFSYNVTFQSRKVGNRLALTGTATIDRDRYQWQGTMQGNTLSGRYSASNGYNGTFQLTQQK